MILFARTGKDVTAFLVESKNEGYRIGKRESFIQAFFIDNGELYLEDYFAHDKHVIGQVGQGFEILLKTEAIGKIAFCSLFVGLAERAIDLAINYANTRIHRDKPIGEKFQMTQVKLAKMMTKIELMNAYLYQTCSKVDQGEDIFVGAAVLKLIVGDQIKEITADAMEVHGAYGLSEEYPIGNLYRTAIGAQAIMGSLDIQRVIIAKSLLGKGRYRWG
jgi:alkylation response protein AidB-like acyl-CoA dehydrogenase